MQIISSPDTVLYNEPISIQWLTEGLTDEFTLQAKESHTEQFHTVYEGTESSYTLNPPYDFNRIKFRVLNSNSEVISESKEITVIDFDIVQNSGGDVTIFPFNQRINMSASKFDNIPSIRETSEIITGLDGELPIDRKYSSRIFDISAFMTDEFENVTERDNYISRMSQHINRAVRDMKYLRYRGRIYEVAVASQPNWEVRPQWCNLTSMPFKCYNVFGYAPEQSVLYGDGVCVNSGEERAYPIITLYGEYNNPTITVNGKEYQIAIDTQPGDIITIDCEKEIVQLERNGELFYLAGAFYLDFPTFNVGNNTVSGASKVEWRNRFITL